MMKMPQERQMPDTDDLRKKYPVGTRLRLLKGIADPFSPKMEGDVLTVSFVDDACQIHGTWDSGGSLALLAGLDAFEVAGRSTDASK